jgi:hypothetical protein
VRGDDLIAMLHHIQYEIRHCMFIPEWRDDAHILKEAIFLSFFVHARALIDFFERSGGRPNDVFSSDFGFPSVRLPLPTEERLRFGKDMMHITSKRLRHTPESKPWPIQETYTAIKPTATAFVDHVIATFADRLPQTEQELWRDLQRILHHTGTQMIVAKE